jgi:hypothetical protein
LKQPSTAIAHSGGVWQVEGIYISSPLLLALATQPGVASAEVVSSWTDFSKSPYIREQKVIFHKGEVGGQGHANSSLMGVSFGKERWFRAVPGMV